MAVVGQKLGGSAALDLCVGDNIATGGDVGLAVVRMSSDNLCRYLAAESSLSNSSQAVSDARLTVK